MAQEQTAEEKLAAERTAAQEKLEQDALLEARSKAPEAELLKVSGYPFVVRPPTATEWERFQTAMHSENAAKKAGAGVTLFLDCCMWPTRAEVRNILQKKPGIPMSVFQTLADMVGAGVAVEKKS